MSIEEYKSFRNKKWALFARKLSFLSSLECQRLLEAKKDVEKYLREKAQLSVFRVDTVRAMFITQLICQTRYEKGKLSRNEFNNVLVQQKRWFLQNDAKMIHLILFDILGKDKVLKMGQQLYDLHILTQPDWNFLQNIIQHPDVDYAYEGTMIPEAKTHFPFPSIENVVQETFSPVVSILDVDTFKKYTLKKPIGKGAMGILYLAHDEKNNRNVVVKFIHKGLSAKIVERFKQEAETHSLLGKHENIVQMYEFGYDQPSQNHFIVMEYVEGKDLYFILKKCTLTIKESLKIGLYLAQALRFIWKKDAIHRDIKPGNIMISTTGEVKLLDFGLGKIVSEDNFLTDGMMGTPFYMALEQIEDSAKVDIRADIYALGATLYALIAKKPPYSECSSALSVIEAKKEREPQNITNHVPNLPVKVYQIISKSMARQASERYQTPLEMIRDIKEALKIVK